MSEDENLTSKIQGLNLRNIHDSSGLPEIEGNILALRNPNVRHEMTSKLSTMTMPYDPTINWKVTPATPLYENVADGFTHLGQPARREQHNTPFYEHPVRFMPSRGEKNLYRTVMIDFIPRGTTYKEVLNQIRGGTLESIQLVDNVGCANDFMTARIVFNYELDAQYLYLHGQDPGLFINNQRLRVWQVLQPTYPKNHQLEEDIFEDGVTRLLLVNNIPSSALTPALTRLQRVLKPQVKAGTVIEMKQEEDGIFLVEFTSVAECAKAMRQLLEDASFRGTTLDFKDDPCLARYQETMCS